MMEIYCEQDRRIVTLSTDEILELHKTLCLNYELLPEMEPVSPAGVKNMHMLESAVSRQLVGSGNYYKYSHWSSNCATLVFGLVKNHSFHNGNKRIGFLSMIKHLYSNGYVLSPHVKHKEIYELLRMLADNSLVDHAYLFNRHFYKQNKHRIWSVELQLKYLSLWIKSNSEHKNTKIKPKTITINELEKILKAKQLFTEYTGKFLIIKKKLTVVQEIFGKKAFSKEYIIKDSKNISLNTIDQIRKEFQISFLDGVDNSSFYNDDDIFTKEIIAYKKIIYKLAKT